MTTAISVTGLRKSFGSTTVLNGLDLSVPEGSVYANGLLSVVWCAAISLAGYLWARAAYDRRPAR
jgi:hypothetical protein